MTTQQTTSASSHDISAFRHTLLALTASHKAVCAGVVVVVAIIWWLLVQRILAFGAAINYQGFESLGPQVVTFLERYNPFFWWVVAIISSLILIYLLLGFIQRSRHRNQQRTITPTQLKQLVQQLSEPAREVLQWVWHDQRHPLTVGNLQQALKELRGGRAGLIALAHEQSAILQAPSHKQPASEVEHYLHSN